MIIEKKNNVPMYLIFLAWLAYMISYMGRINYSANITQIIDHFGITKAQAGVPPTFFFFAYGIGQVVNGLLCKKYNIRYVISISVTVSAIINFAVAVTNEFFIIKWLWLINGCVLSMLWPTLIRALSEALPKKYLSKSSIIMGTTIAVSTLIMYGMSSVFALFEGFRLAFYISATLEVLVGIVWFAFYKKILDKIKVEKEEDVITDTVSTATVQQEKRETRIFYAAFTSLCFCAIGVNLIKDGLTTWVPSILKEEFSMNDSLSIVLTLFLPVIAIFGNAFALNIHKKIPDYVTHCFIVFAVVFFLMGSIVGSMILKIAVSMLSGLIVAYFLISSLNSLLTSIFPMFMREKVNSGMCAGVINGFCYVGSTISSYGLGVIADNFGWVAVFYVLMGICLLITLVWTVYKVIKKALKTEHIL